jgi:AcrR family transcriptional regulator
MRFGENSSALRMGAIIGCETVDSPTAQPAAAIRRRLTRAEAQAATRQRVLDAAADVFGEKGFRAASLSDVADRVGHTIGAV